LAAATPGLASPILSASTSVSWDENITRCPYPGGTRDAVLYDLNGVAEWHNQLSRDVSLQYGLSAGYEACPRFDGLDRMLAGLQVSVRRKVGLGPFAPAFNAAFCYTGDWYRESLHRGTRFTANLSWSQRWNDAWQTVLTADVLHNNGHGAAYDYHNRGLSLEARYDISARWELAAGGGRRWGDQITYAWLGGGGATFPYAFEIWKNTIDIPTFGPNWYAYSIDGHADTVWFSFSPALGALRFEQTSVVGRGESYRTRQVSLSFVFRF